MDSASGVVLFFLYSSRGGADVARHFPVFLLFISVHLLQPLRSAQYYNVKIANNLKTRCGYEFRMEFS